MGLWDVEEEIEDFIDENYIQKESNQYLSNTKAAIGLIAKIIPLSRKNNASRKTIQELDDMLKVGFLSSFRHIRLNNEAQLQIKLAQLSDKLVEQKKYEILKNRSVVGIGGKFSAGKSKFINSILSAGENLLPEDQNPTTSIPTYIVYGEQEEIHAYTSDNKKVVLDAEALQALTHKFYEKYGMGFSSFVNSLIVFEPDMPYKELAFLDTPGYSKADYMGEGKNQKELTDENKAYAQLRGVDYLIWLMDIENGVLSETDISFITKLGLETPILIVVNKSDKKIDEEIEQIVRLVETTARNAGIKVFGVTAYSARDGAEWRSAGQISEYLRIAMTEKKNKKDILNQISEIEQSVSQELDAKIEFQIRERNMLSNVIFKSENVMEIKTLVDLYGESMEEIRDIIKCRRKYQNNVQELERTLENYYGRRNLY